MSLRASIASLRGAGPSRTPGQLSAILRNAGWILAGKGFGGLLSLGYIAMAARALGPATFGVFVLTLAFGQGIAGIAQFQSAEVLIRFGARHLADRSPDRLARMVGFAAVLDIMSAAACIVLGLVVALWFAPAFGLAHADAKRAAIFAASFIFVLRGTPVGVLRLFNRFDLAALVESLVPAVRLVAAGIGYLFASRIAWFLGCWAFAEFLATLAMWAAAAREVRRYHGLPLGRGIAEWRRAPLENHRLWSFAWFTNMTSGVGFLRQQAGTLLVGWQAGAATAGGYRIAQQLAQAVSKPVVALSRAVYPDLAHVAVSGGTKAVSGLTARLSFFGGALGLVAVVLVAFAGKWILTTIAGPQFASASTVFLLLTIAGAVELWAFGQEPAMMALGRAGALLTIRAITSTITIALMFVLLNRYGAVGAAGAVVFGNILARVTMSIALRRFTRSPRAAAPVPTANAIEADDA